MATVKTVGQIEQPVKLKQQPAADILPVQPKTPVAAETMAAGTGVQTQAAQTPAYNESTAVKQLQDAAALQSAAQQARNQPQTAAQQQEKAYTMEELEAFQQEMSAQDKAEMQDLGQTIYRAGKYTNTPSATTIRLATPIDGMWYYDYGEKQYLNKWNEPASAGGGQQMQQQVSIGAGANSDTGPTQAVNKDGGVSGGGNDLTSLLEEWKKAAAEQANGQIDYAVSQAITELERALEDSKGMYKEQAESVARDEMQALDNSALYAEMRGDKGGIGQSQYNEIQAAAAQNRLAVQQAQTKLSTDTARQIADLRAQGEFQKADKALEITQQYLSQLINLEQWAAEFGLSRAQFEASLEQWQAEYDMAMDEFDYNVATNERGYTASMAEALMAAGVPLDDAQLKALGWSRDQYNEYLRQQELREVAGGNTQKFTSLTDLYSALREAGITSDADAAAQAKLWGYTGSVGDYAAWLKNNTVNVLESEVAKEARAIVSRLRANGATSDEMWKELDSIGLPVEVKLALAEEFGIN